MKATNNKNKTSLLLVEDEPNFGSVLKNYLELKNFNVTLCMDGVEGYNAFLNSAFDLCILDVMMPKKDGFTLASEIREDDKSIPIIFLTAKGMKDDVLNGFRVGADDYLTKPFDSEVLLMKINAILKRSSASQQADDVSDFVIGNYSFNYQYRIVKKAGNEQRLSPKEAGLLRLLCLHINDILPRQKALRQIWGDENYFTSRSMDVFITRLRKIFKDDSRIVISNIHGKGFSMEVKS